MPTFRYSAKDQEARTVNAKIVANDEMAVLDELRSRRLIVISIDEEKRSQFSFGALSNKTSSITTEDIILFSRQMATMVDAGIPILQTMEALEEQTVNPSFKKVLGTIRDDIRLGTSLSAAFAKHNKVFDNLFVNMLKVGESSYMEKTAKLKRKVQGAMIYPAVVVSMALLITTGLIVKVVPTFASIYSSFGRELPAMTQFLLDLSSTIRNNGVIILAGLFGAGFAFVSYQKTPAGAYHIDNLKLKMPVFGVLICKVAVSRFCRTLSVLVQSGVPILEGLEIVRKTIGNRVLEKLMEDVIQSVREGESIAAPLSRSRVFPSMVTKMISIGEQSGQLDKMLIKVSDFFDEQVDAMVETLTSLIEPFVIGFLGIVIGFVVIALFMPIISMTQMIN